MHGLKIGLEIVAIHPNPGGTGRKTVIAGLDPVIDLA
jgi:hypothetical protein